MISKKMISFFGLLLILSFPMLISDCGKKSGTKQGQENLPSLPIQVTGIKIRDQLVWEKKFEDTKSSKSIDVGVKTDESVSISADLNASPTVPPGKIQIDLTVKCLSGCPNNTQNVSFSKQGTVSDWDDSDSDYSTFKFDYTPSFGSGTSFIRLELTWSITKIESDGKTTFIGSPTTIHGLQKINTLTICTSDSSKDGLCEPLPTGEVLLQGDKLRLSVALESSSRSIQINANTIIPDVSFPPSASITLQETGDNTWIYRETQDSDYGLIQQDSGGFVPLFTFSSADLVRDPTKSNFNDSKQFDSDMSSAQYTARGQARTTEGDSDLTNGQPGVTKTYLQSGGAVKLKVCAPQISVCDEKHFVQRQALFFYYSGHGSSLNGGLLAYDYANLSVTNWITPDNFTGYWNKNLVIVILAGCSVVNVIEYPYVGLHYVSLGPSYILGYYGSAPADTSKDGDEYFTAKIIANWYKNLSKPYGSQITAIVQAWGDANLLESGVLVTAAAFDLSGAIGSRKWWYVGRSAFGPQWAVIDEQYWRTTQ